MAREKCDISVKDKFITAAPDKLTVPGYTEPGELTPAVDESYVLGKGTNLALAWLKAEARDGLYINGPTQCGKTTLIRQICARANAELIEVTAYEGMEMADLVGHYVNIGGDMIWQDGPLTVALRRRCMFLINEGDMLEPAVAVGLNPILEGQPLVLTDNGGEIVPRKHGFRLVVTANTNGAGDETGVYQGTLRQNAAFMERFWVLEMDYLNEADEIKLLIDETSINVSVAKSMHQVASLTRGETSNRNDPPAAVELPMSTHSLLRWAKIAKCVGINGKGNASDNALTLSFDVAYANRLSAESRFVVDEELQRVFGNARRTRAA